MKPLTDPSAVTGWDRLYLIIDSHLLFGVSNVAFHDIGGTTFSMVEVVIKNVDLDTPIAVDASQLSFITSDNRVMVPGEATGDMVPLAQALLRPTRVIKGTSVTGAVVLPTASTDRVITAIWNYGGVTYTIDLTSTRPSP